MADTTVRILQLLALLQSHRYWSGQELADRLGVSLRTLRRDVDRLREVGYPIDAERGVGGGYQMAPGAAMPPLVLDDDEAVALTVGLHLAAQATVSGIAESAVGALAKAIQVMPRRLRRRDRKSTRLNSSHVSISYAVFCLKKKKKHKNNEKISKNSKTGQQLV